MAFSKNFTYDIFISYAHVDNLQTSWENLGWIEKFYKDLDTLLIKKTGRAGVVKIWWDSQKLDGSILFDASIKEGIMQSAVMICLNSPGYSKSAYCQKEVDLFYAKASREPSGLQVKNRSRILHVLMYNINYKEWPPALSGTSGFAFYETKDKEDSGSPLDTNSIEFRNKLLELRDAIVKIIDTFSTQDITDPSAPPITESAKDPAATSIYIAEVTDSLHIVRKRTITELEKKGFDLIYGLPPPYEAQAHEQKVKEALQQADFSVHLLDQYAGREIAGVQENWYPQKQAAIALELPQPKVIWIPSETDFSLVEEEPYKLFLQNLETGKASSNSFEYIRGTKGTLTQQIADFAMELKLQQQQLAAEKKIAVLLDTHFNDQIYALDLSKTLLANQIQPFINPQEDDPRKNMGFLAERISQVTKLIFFYGQVSREWVLERMSAALQLIITNNYPVDAFYIYQVPPHKKPNDISLRQRFLKVSIIDNSEQVSPDNNLLEQFLRTLKGETV